MKTEIIDRNAEYLGIPRLLLMENAGRCLAEKIVSIAETENEKISIFCGSGGNGGDGLVAARHLVNRGFKVEVFLMTHPQRIRSKETIKNWEIINNMTYSDNLNVNVVLDSSYLPSSVDGIIVDAMLGTGIKGKIREPIRSAIKLINDSNAVVVAVDVPSGLDPTTGKISDIAVKADYTITFHKIKKGLDTKTAGKIIVCDIGIPKEAEVFVGPGDLIRIKRNPESHKGENGKVLIIGGSPVYSGAPALSGLAALQAGCDLVTILCPKTAAPVIKSYSPDLIVKEIDSDYVDKIDMELVEKSDSIVIGPGLEENPKTRKAFKFLIREIDDTTPIVIDADALKLVEIEDIKDFENIVLTPHLGEFKRLFKISGKDLKSKIKYVTSASKKINGVILLKGKIDIIAQNGKIRLNRTGNPGMTVGGTGDVLSGIVASLISQKLRPFDAACLGAFINGKAGDLASEIYGYNFTATKMLKFIPKAMKLK